MVLKGEKKCLASEAATYIYYLKRMRGSRQKILNFNNLALVKNHAINCQKRQKPEAKWLRLRLFVLYFVFNLTGYVCKIYDDGKAKNDYLNNILLFEEKK